MTRCWGVVHFDGVAIASLGFPRGHVYDGHYEEFTIPGQTGMDPSWSSISLAYISTRGGAIQATIVFWP